MHTFAATNSIITILLALGFVNAWQNPQQPQQPQQQQEPVARITTDLVQLDIIVTDRSGKPVKDLKREDFELLEDGKVQAITHFAQGTAAKPARWITSARPSGGTAGAAAPASLEPRSRYLVFMVDDLHISFENLTLAKRALSKFVKNNLMSGDLVAMATTSGQIGLLQQFTKERAAIDRAINRLYLQERKVTSAYDIPRISDYQAELIDMGDPDAIELAVQEILKLENPQAANTPPRGGRSSGSSPPGMGMSPRDRAVQTARTKARMIVGENAHYTQSTLISLEATIRNLRDLPGQKLVILVSDGFFLGGSSASKVFDIRRVTDAATKSGVVIYSIDSRGLVATLGFGDASQPSGFTPELPGQRERIESGAVNARKDGLNALARDTGGYLVHNSNDLLGGLQRVMEDNEYYYILAYEPLASYSDGRFRKIEVRFPSRSDLKARTRTGYFSPNERDRAAAEVKTAEKIRTKSPDELRQTDVRRALGSLFPVKQVPTEVTAAFVNSAEEGIVAVVTAHLDVSALKTIENAGNRSSSADVVIYIFDDKGKIAGRSSEKITLNLKEAAFAEAQKNGIDYRKLFPLKPGFYQVRVAVRDDNSGQLGSSSGWVEVPDLTKSKLTLSGIMLTKLTFRTDESADYLVFAYNSKVESGQTDLVVQSQVFLNSQLVYSSPLAKMPTEPVTDIARIPYAARLNLSSFEPGEYELRTMVIDRLARLTADRRINFVIEK